jgi:hypothetical protein
MEPPIIFKVPQPRNRLLQVFAFDPSLNFNLETAVINQLVLSVPWEEVGPGPVGEYLEIVDIDPASNAFYPPIRLNDPHLLAQNGLSPSEGTPQFHQQMVYAIASKTIQSFEQALGRQLLWPPRLIEGKEPEYVGRLRIYPHAIRDANAYYSPEKKAILFGYFPASTTDAGNNLPGGIVFSCLSHDIIAHEMTHAILDGLHPYFTEPSNVDVLALHEAFADVIALFQHFSHADVLRHQIGRTRGDLSSANLLAELAQQFGQAIGNRGALRSAIGRHDRQTGEWQRTKPAPELLESTTEPHNRGALLLTAIFDAFLILYQSRTADLYRIATSGSGVLPNGAIHPDLRNRLAEEAAKISGRFLTICIRALDYCPPVDITFGDYLRAMITADHDLVPDDRDGYRIALVEAFRRHGIYPSDVRSLSEESLLWHPPSIDKAFQKFFTDHSRMHLIQQMRLEKRREEIFNQSQEYSGIFREWLCQGGLVRDIMESLNVDEANATKTIEKELRLKLLPDDKHRTVHRDPDGKPTIEINSVRPAYRVGPSGHTITDLVVEISQRRDGYMDEKIQKKVDTGELKEPPTPDFLFRGGTTLLIDMETGSIRYAIGKNITSDRRLGVARRYYEMRQFSLAYTYFGTARNQYMKAQGSGREPFAMLHRGEFVEEDF